MRKIGTVVNFRPILFCALGLVYGIALYFRIRFGGFAPSDLLFLALFPMAAFPFGKKRVLAVLLSFLLFSGAGAGFAHAGAERFLSGPKEGEYHINGTVYELIEEDDITFAVLGRLSFDKKRCGGKMQIDLETYGIREGDVIAFDAEVLRNPISGKEGEYCFSADLRYVAAAREVQLIGKTRDPMLLLRAALHRTLDRHLDPTRAEVAYALLTGNSHGMDEGLLEEVRRGGIAHIFAVSGLHIGILYGAVVFLFRRLERFSTIPASLFAFLYTAFCGFTVSAVRAFVMCTALGLLRVIGKKHDFLTSLSLSALCILPFLPSEFLSAGFRLSFGACLGLGLFSGTVSRLLGRIPHFPAFLRDYLSANFSVQIVTFPILLETFGYFSVWGSLLNLFLIPLLPAFFLSILLFSLLALIIPPAAGFFLAVPNGLLGVFTAIFSFADFSAVLAGFSLGAGGTIWLVGCILLSERVRLAPLVRGIAAGVLVLLFTAAVVMQNVVFTGTRIDVSTTGSGTAALVRTPHAAVLVIDELSLGDAEDFLLRRYGKTLDGIIVLGEDELVPINRAAFLPAEAVYAKDEISTGLRETAVVFGDRVTVGGLEFVFESREKLTLVTEGLVVEFDFDGEGAFGADLFVHPVEGDLIFSLRHGIIKSL